MLRRDLGAFWRCHPPVRHFFAHFFADERGQDLIEYALLASIIGVTSVLAFPLVGRMGTAFSGWGTGVQSLWIPDPPTP